ncbi:MAG: F0F1 ATP synthase subunit B [Longispora sp.]|nr:F0F1 ATP synthase subunit B [Longispora sp. (in: high G+C Gram-positive bacteria)]
MDILAQEGEHNPLIPIWQELILGSIAFALLCFVVMKYVFPKMEQTFQARVDAIEGGLKRAEEAQAKANEMLEQYRLQLAEARTEAATIRDEARMDAGSIKDDILAAAREERDRIIATGRDQLLADRQALITELRTEIGSLSVELASRIVGESLADEARRQGTVDRFLAELENGDVAPAGRR